MEKVGSVSEGWNKCVSDEVIKSPHGLLAYGGTTLRYVRIFLRGVLSVGHGDFSKIVRKKLCNEGAKRLG